MMWDDDEQYIPPNIVNENFYIDRPAIFADDQFNSLVFSQEDLK